jgi:hypothetical protein
MPLITASGRAAARFIGEILAKLNPPDYSTFSRRAAERTV